MTDKALVVDPRKIKHLKRKIIMQENRNLKSKAMNDAKMVEWIKKAIEEEVECYSSR